MKITAVIPVRKGSQRVPNKNLRPFADTTLMELKIKTLLKVPEFDSIVVNTDSNEAIDITLRYMGGVGIKSHITAETSTMPPLNVREVSSFAILAR